MGVVIVLLKLDMVKSSNFIVFIQYHSSLHFNLDKNKVILLVIRTEQEKLDTKKVNLIQKYTLYNLNVEQS